MWDVLGPSFVVRRFSQYPQHLSRRRGHDRICGNSNVDFDLPSRPGGTSDEYEHEHEHQQEYGHEQEHEYEHESVNRTGELRSKASSYR
jgi:ABC-type nickel/cobalt efflux system permease component RcnA